MNKILLDASVCRLGYSGIPQDIRRIFGGLAGNIDIFINTYAKSTKKHNTVGYRRYIEAESILKRVGSKCKTSSVFNGRSLERIDWVERREFFWRKYFSKGVNRHIFENIADISSYTRKVSNIDLLTRYLPNFIDTSGYEYVLIPMPSKTKVSKSSVKVIRHYDSIPISHPDLINEEAGNQVKQHWDNLKSCVDEPNTLFTCISDVTRDELLYNFSKLDPKRVSVIPCSIDPDLRFLNDTRSKLPSIIVNKLYRENLERKNVNILRLINNLKSIVLNSDYILTVSNIDPKKDYKTLISAWEKARLVKPDLRLVIVSELGWEYKDILRRIEPHIINGDIIHLHALSSYELSILYSNAAAFVFPSIIEGFGLGILEAAHCKCPVIASNIPAHNYVLNDGFYKCKVGDANEFASAIVNTLDESMSSQIETAYKRSCEFTVENVRNRWNNFFNI